MIENASTENVSNGGCITQVRKMVVQYKQHQICMRGKGTCTENRNTKITSTNLQGRKIQVEITLNAFIMRFHLHV